MGQPLDHLGPPALLCLPGQNIVADLPVEQHQFAVYRQRGALLGAMDAAFEVC
ncbi:hypothetical protein D3C78_1277640 [compost metagenome]